MSKRYVEKKSLGRGRTGSVHEARDTKTGKRVTIRRFDVAPAKFENQSVRSEFFNTTGDLCRMNHPNILKALDSGIDDRGAYLVTEMASGLHLSKLMKSPGKGLPMNAAYQLAVQMLGAYEEAASYGFYHYALSPSSVLGTEMEDGSFHFKLIDLGLSRLQPLLSGGDEAIADQLDPALMASEVYEGKPEGAKSSLYMLGQLLYWVCAGGHPMAGLSLATANAKHKAGEIPFLRGYRADLPEIFRKWIYYLIQPDLSLRLRSISEARLLIPSFKDFQESVRVLLPRKMELDS